MLGRGALVKGEKFQDKSHFTVFDCFDGTLTGVFPERYRDHWLNLPKRNSNDQADHW
jgi:type I site-specific restriction endonuclease